jgi:hypothetical protein
VTSELIEHLRRSDTDSTTLVQQRYLDENDRWHVANPTPFVRGCESPPSAT